MAVEIKELVIKAVIVNDQANSYKNPSEMANPIDRDQLVQECVNQVLKIIKKSKIR